MTADAQAKIAPAIGKQGANAGKVSAVGLIPALAR